MQTGSLNLVHDLVPLQDFENHQPRSFYNQLGEQFEA